MEIFTHLHQARRNPFAYYTVYLLLLVLAACSTTTTPNTSNQRPAQTPANQSFQCSAHSSNPVTLTMYYGSEKEAWINDVVATFNSQNITACDGPITVKAVPLGSGQSMQEIVAALGWPNKAIGWADIAALSTNPRGWAAYGHPEFGDFKFGHTHPDYSNSGLDAVIAENYAAVGKVRGLTAVDVTNPKTKAFVTNVESSVIHYGDSTGFFADKMFSKGPGYLSATVMYESLVVQANDGRTYPHLAYPVVAIYPKEGTFYSDHPFVIPQASWVTSAKRAAALKFRDFLLATAQQKKALQYGFRPANLSVPVGVPIDAAHGVDPNQPSTLLQVPSSDVVSAIQSNWNQQRRRVDVMLILDRSGSMSDSIGDISKIDGAKKGLTEFVNLLSDSDQLGLTAFSDSADVLSPVSPLGSKRQDLLNTINGINADGGTRLFDTISEQVKALNAVQTHDIKAVVVLTDGMDTASQLSIDQLVSQVTPGGEDAGNGVKVFTIAYGGDADVDGLTKIANAGGGQEYTGTPQNIRQVYLQISEFF